MNLLFDDHPADMENMIVVDRIATRNNIAKVIFVVDLEVGTITQSIVYEAKPIKGLIVKIILFDVFIFLHSFVISFRASDIGCIIPL